jgi:beta-galactosidase
VAHGADAVLYWQWRSALGGQEQYHGTLVDQAGQPRPFYEEAQQLGHDLATASSLLAGSTVVSQVALLNSYDSRWSIQWQRHHRDFDYVAHLIHYYRPLATRNIAADVISADAPLEGYRLILAPALVMVSESQARQLRDFVKRGGHLVLTVRCGMKDEYNALLPSRQPGPLADLAGVEVEEYYALLDPVPVLGNWFTGSSQLWAERLKVRDADNTHVMARFGASNGWLDDRLAITVHSYGKGLVYYVGAYLDGDAQQALMDHIVKMAGIRPVMDTPAGVEARVRVSPEGRRIYILVNHEREEQAVSLPWPAQDHLGGQPVADELKLAPYGVAILTRLQEKAQ